MCAFTEKAVRIVRESVPCGVAVRQVRPSDSDACFHRQGYRAECLSMHVAPGQKETEATVARLSTIMVESMVRVHSKKVVLAVYVALTLDGKKQQVDVMAWYC